MLPIIFVSLSLLLAVSGQQTCNVTTFYQCQTAFASTLKMPSGSDWHNPTQLAGALQVIFATGLPGWNNALVGVCNAYNGLIQCLGPMAPACMDPLYLLNNDNDPEEAYGYMSVMNGLAFDCGAGFYAGISNWDCIQRVYANYNATLFGCVSSFVQSVVHDPNNACDYLQTGLSCLSAPYQALCQPAGKWFGCETWRMYLTTRLYTCPASCTLSTSKFEQEYFEQHPEWKEVKP